MRASLLPLLLSIFVVASASSSSFGLSSNEPALDEGESKTSYIDPAILFLVIGGDVDDEPTDTDNDGIEDGQDQCPDSDLDAAVDLNGCSSSQLDEDNDGVSDAEDQCPDSDLDAAVDLNGCSSSQLDEDNDGVSDAEDQCPDSDLDAAVDLDGCTSSQLDDDNDGVSDAEDQCPDSDLDAAVDLNGCTSSQLDEDNDGVSDAEDQCPNSSVGVTVDIVGCEDLSISVREVYETDVNPLIVSQSGGCTSSGCHGRANAPGGLRLYPLSNSNNVQLNYNAFVSYIDSRSGNALLGKISGTSGHGGGTRYSSTSTQYQIIEDWVRSVEALP